MLPRWSRAISHLSRVSRMKSTESCKEFLMLPHHNFAKLAAAAAPTATYSSESILPGNTEVTAAAARPATYPSENTLSSNTAVNLDKMFRSKPCSLALAPDSPLRIEDPQFEGLQRFLFKLMLFYSKESKYLRAANAVFHRIRSQVDKPPIYEVFNLQKTFKTTLSLFILHMWLYLRRVKEDGKEGVEFGQYVYEIYDHDMELRVDEAGVNLLLGRWMKELEKIFYGNIIAYDNAMLPDAKQDELANCVWRNIFSDDGSAMPADPAVQSAVQIRRRYFQGTSPSHL